MKKHASPGRAVTHPSWQVVAIQLLSNNCLQPIVELPLGSQRVCVNFVIDTRAQMSVISRETPKDLSIKPDHCKVTYKEVTRIVNECPTVKITLQLLWEKLSYCFLSPTLTS